MFLWFIFTFGVLCVKMALISRVEGEYQMKKTRLFFLVFGVLCLILCLAACEDAHTHDWGAWETVTPATCGTKGEEKRTCACGESETAPIPATGAHSWSAWEQTTAPTCQSQGEQTSTCACGATNLIKKSR